MGFLKHNSDDMEKVRNNISKIINQLKNLESNDSVLFSNWLLNKSRYFKQHSQRKPFGNIPKNISKGDIVRVDFGINVGDELSEKGQDCHFSLVWGQKGFLFIVIPLTKTPQIGNEFAVNLGKIEGLPNSEINTWAKLEGIRSISIRRIKRMHEFEDGKISIKENDDLMNAIKDKIIERFID